MDQHKQLLDELLNWHIDNNFRIINETLNAKRMLEEELAQIQNQNELLQHQIADYKGSVIFDCDPLK